MDILKNSLQALFLMGHAQFVSKLYPGHLFDANQNLLQRYVVYLYVGTCVLFGASLLLTLLIQEVKIPVSIGISLAIALGTMFFLPVSPYIEGYGFK